VTTYTCRVSVQGAATCEWMDQAGQLTWLQQRQHTARLPAGGRQLAHL